MVKHTKKEEAEEDDRKDLTRLEDLSLYEHSEDEEVNLRFSESNSNSDEENLEASLEFDQFAEVDDLPPDLPDDVPGHLHDPIEPPADIFFNDTEENLEGNLNQAGDNFQDELSEEIPNNFSLDSHSEIMSEMTQEIADIEDDSPLLDELNNNLEETLHLEEELPSAEETNYFDDSSLDNADAEENEIFPDHEENDLTPHQRFSATDLNHENFEEVKNFAQHFSPTAPGVVNPPFSIVIKNIKFKEDADDILRLLKEFKVVTESNLKETETALDLGTLLIPHISEFTAITLAHKFRRYDFDLDVGLSDEIQPSKLKNEYAQNENTKGPIKKGHLRQNKEEEIKLHGGQTSIDDMLLSTSNLIEGFTVKSYLGIEHSHSFIEEDELMRLSYVEKGLRTKNPLSADDQKIFEQYKEGFKTIHDELLKEVKNKSFKEGANALLGIHFGLNVFNEPNKNIFKITCSCTKAIITKANSIE